MRRKRRRFEGKRRGLEEKNKRLGEKQMKGRINLASAATKASAKGRLSRARSGARSRGKKGMGRGERERGRRAQHAGEPGKHIRYADTEQHNKILFESTVDKKKK